MHREIQKNERHTRNGVEITVHEIINGVVYVAKHKIGSDWGEGQLWKMPISDYLKALREEVTYGSAKKRIHSRGRSC